MVHALHNVATANTLLPLVKGLEHVSATPAKTRVTSLWQVFCVLLQSLQSATERAVRYPNTTALAAGGNNNDNAMAEASPITTATFAVAGQARSAASQRQQQNGVPTTTTLAERRQKQQP